MTATINPSENVPSLVRRDRFEREKDYVEAIRYWTRFKIPIVFCENSNTRSDKIISILSTSNIKYEYLSFESQKSHLGKGNGEAEIFEYAFENSLLFKSCTSIIKLTGRYTIKNFTKLLSFTENGNKQLHINISQNLTWADSRFFSFTPLFWKEILSKHIEKIDENNGMCFENILAKSTLEAISRNYAWSYTKNSPRYQGIYGTINTRYSDNYIKFIIKNIIFKLRKYLVQSSRN